MKILPGAQQAALVAEIADKKTEQPAASTKKAAPKAPRQPDQVDFSASLAAAMKAQQELQAQRVQSIKALVQAGTYQVSSRDVAEKMLSNSSDF